MEFFYGIPWKMSKSFMENIDGEISMETGFLILHGIPWQPFPWNSMDNIIGDELLLNFGAKFPR